MQGGYLIVKGLLKKKTTESNLFDVLDELFEIPKEKEKQQKTKEELIDDFEKYVKGV